MNIFKILASGDGSIKEPNVSAFLSFLLDPKKDHGISDEFLKRLLRLHYKNNINININDKRLDFLVDKNKYIRNFDSLTGLNIKVLLEQTFYEGKKGKEIVDIVLLCYENVDKNTGETIAKRFLSKHDIGDLKHIFLIENKIDPKAKKEGQLKSQYYQTIEALKEIMPEIENVHDRISLIFISPDDEYMNIEFENTKFDDFNILKSHFYWNTDNDDFVNDNTICNILKNILNDEMNGNIEAINDYTKYTIKSFIKFIVSNFKSLIQEDLDGKWQKTILSEEDYWNTKQLHPHKGLALNIKNRLVLEYKINPKYTPTYIAFKYKFKNFCNIKLNKSNIIISIQKDPTILWDDFKIDLKKQYNGIVFNENTSYNDSWFELKIKDFDEFEAIALPLLTLSWKYLDKKIN